MSPRFSANAIPTDWTDAEQLRQDLLTRQISPNGASLISSLGRPSLHLLPASAQSSGLKSFTKIGGCPDLPDGIDWPMRPSMQEACHEENPSSFARFVDMSLTWLGVRRPGYLQSHQPYSFIAQLSFAELAEHAPGDVPLPQTGGLYLFYDAVAQRWGFDPTDRTGFRVIYAEDVSKTRLASPPNFHEDAPQYAPLHLEPHLVFEQPPPTGLHFESLPLTCFDEEAYRDSYASIVDREELEPLLPPAHKVMGWPDIRQNPIEEECALVTNGVYCGGGRYQDPATVRRIMSETNDWRLLLQIDSDRAANMIWGDVGSLYLGIKEADLRARKFDNTWLVLQC